MSYTADLHLHSPFAYACSKNLTLENITAWAKVKGIDLLASADFTHPKWREELGRKLTPVAPGMYTFNGVHFVLGTEVSCVYSQGGKGRRVHLLLLAPDFETVDRIRRSLTGNGNKLESDGRPTLKMSARDFTALALETNSECVVIPAHVWTPWYGVFGSKSGFDHLEECFQDMTPHINSLETGLSSDPGMMWPIGELATHTIVSFSDAHSAPKLGRELTVFKGELSYSGLTEDLASQGVDHTIEFYPQEGKYHYSGHRKCGVRQAPEDTDKEGYLCRVCKRPLTIGVLHRVRSLADANPVDEDGILRNGENGMVHPSGVRPPFIRLLPLMEVIAETLGLGPSTRRVEAEYQRLTRELGTELQVLTAVSANDLMGVAGERMSEAIMKARRGEVRIDPGYDGVYGKISVLAN